MKNILGKMYKIMSEIGYIQKDKENTNHRYRYASEYAIKEKFHEQLVKHQVLFFLSATNSTEREVRKSSGGVESLVLVDFSYSFVDVETGEKVDGFFIGSGQDTGDKGVYKAVTGAIKYILTSNFLIPTGDDPEDEESEDGMMAKRDPAQTEKAITYEKICPKCGKAHQGKFPTCYDCYVAKK